MFGGDGSVHKGLNLKMYVTESLNSIINELNILKTLQFDSKITKIGQMVTEL